MENPLFISILFISLILANDYDQLWKPLAIILVIYPFVYILCNYTLSQRISFITMGLIGYISGLLYHINLYQWASLSLFLAIYFNFYGLKDNSTIIVGRIMIILIVLGLTVLIRSNNYALPKLC